MKITNLDRAEFLLSDAKDALTPRIEIAEARAELLGQLSRGFDMAFEESNENDAILERLMELVNRAHNQLDRLLERQDILFRAIVGLGEAAELAKAPRKAFLGAGA